LTSNSVPRPSPRPISQRCWVKSDHGLLRELAGRQASSRTWWP
jgi:hypothetical protein